MSTEYTEIGSISQTNFLDLPAVVIGGPPHSGKSVLAYSLTRALREREIPHYLLRAYPPDYEGDWFLASEPETVRHLRFKGLPSAAWLPLLQRDIAARHLPLLVDVGGLPTPEQETLLAACTHGILLTPDPASRALWAERFTRYQLPVLADITSELHGSQHLAARAPVLRGTLAGLERGQVAQGPLFAALVERLAAWFIQVTQGLPRQHLAAAPAELALDLPALARQLGQDPQQWQPAALPEVLDYLPQGQPLALYGRGPNWLIAALARYTRPAPCYLFDARMGWLEVPALPVGPALATSPLQGQVEQLPQGDVWRVQLPTTYLDWTERTQLHAPVGESTAGVIFSGKLPQWLWAALVRAVSAPWVAVYQPQLAGAVVVQGCTGHPPGTVLSVTL